MHYSPSINGFYSTEIHGENMPADAVAITPERHAQLLADQVAGKQIKADAEGFPKATERVVLIDFATQKLGELTKFRADRVLLLNAIAGMAALGGFDAANIMLLVAFRQGLLDLPKAAAVTAATDLAALKTAMATQYASLVAPLPTALRNSFKASLS